MIRFCSQGGAVNFIRCKRAVFCFVLVAASNCFALTFVEQAKLDAEAEREALAQFGASVSIDGDTAVVGSILQDDGDTNDAGAAYVFVRSGTTWTRQAKLRAQDSAAGDQF